MTSEISGFYKLPIEKRLEILKKEANLSEEDIEVLKNGLSLKVADGMIENVIGTMQLPLGIATNFLINGKDYLIPMAIEEPSVVAAASNAAKIARKSGGFKAESDPPIMIGQIQLINVKNLEIAKKKILENKERIKEICDKKDSLLIKLGGGFKDIFFNEFKTELGEMLIVNLLIDVRDAMGANAVNTMCESVAPFIEELLDCKSRLKIISNLAIYRKARAEAVFSKEALEESFSGNFTGDEIVSAILEAYEFAKNDIFRCATHNKGIMNGIDALTIATGNDFRAIESGAHSFASLNGYHPLTQYYKNNDGDLVGKIELPLAFGLVGGATRTHPVAKVNIKILGVKTAQELAEVAASLGLAQNFAALRALATEGIQRGHMRLHARNIAINAGAEEDEIDFIVRKMIEENNVSVSRAKELLKGMR